MATNERKPEQLDYAKAEFLIARYSSLREEIQHRDTNNYQLISLHLTIAAAILTFGLQKDTVASVIFIIPITSVLLGLLAVHNFLTREQLKTIIKDECEAAFNISSKDSAYRIGIVGASGVFFVIQILAFILGLIKVQHYTTLDLVLIISDIIALFASLTLFYTVLKARVKK